MNAFAVIAITLGTSLLVGAAGFAVFRLIGIELRRRHLEVGTALFLQLGVIYAVFLAFVFGQALDGFVAADNAIDAECSALHGAAIFSSALPEPERGTFVRSMRAYVADVIDVEWAVMETTRRASPKTSDAERVMLEQANGWRFKDADATAVQSRITAMLITAHAERERRIFEAGQGIPVGLWVMILIYAGSLVVLVLFSSLDYIWSHAVLCGVFGGLNALILLAVFLLQYPFEGPFQLSPKTFYSTAEKLRLVHE